MNPFRHPTSPTERLLLQLVKARLEMEIYPPNTPEFRAAVRTVWTLADQNPGLPRRTRLQALTDIATKQYGKNASDFLERAERDKLAVALAP